VIGRSGALPADLDGVLIATPSDTHADIAVPYLERGIATFIEKPMATSSADAARIQIASRRSGAAVFVGHIYLYNPAFRKMLELLPTLGAIQYVVCEGLNNDPGARASVTWEWLPHHLSMGRAIFGRDPARVSAWSLTGPENPRGAVSRFLFGETPLVSMASWLSPIRRRPVTIPCENGTLVFDDLSDHKLALYGADGAVTYPPYDSEPPLTSELRSFLAQLHGRSADRPHLDDGLSIVRAIEAANRSIRSGGAEVVL
jgi:predicted dehydrogenase